MSTQKNVLQRFGAVEGNELRIEQGKAEQIIDALNTDLVATYVLHHQLRKHHWNVEGAEFRDLHRFLGEAAEHAEEAADEIAERLQAVGGTPVAGPAAIADMSPVESEGEDVYDIRTSLRNDLEMYGTTSSHCVTASNSRRASATTRRRRSWEILVQTEEDAHHVEHYLEDDTLVTDAALQQATE